MTEGVYVAVGFAIANSVLIEAPDGAIIVDVTESIDAGREVYAAFRNITEAPIKAIIYTHNHADHMYGAQVRWTVDPFSHRAESSGSLGTRLKSPLV